MKKEKAAQKKKKCNSPLFSISKRFLFVFGREKKKRNASQ